MWWIVDDNGCGCGCGGGGFVLRWVVVTTVVVVVGCCEFLWGKFYFILISCLYYFNEMNVKIEYLMLGVSC